MLVESETKVESCAHFLSKTKHLVEKLLCTNNAFFIEPVRQQAQHCLGLTCFPFCSTLTQPVHTQNPPLCWNSGPLRVPWIRWEGLQQGIEQLLADFNTGGVEECSWWAEAIGTCSSETPLGGQWSCLSGRGSKVPSPAGGEVRSETASTFTSG